MKKKKGSKCPEKSSWCKPGFTDVQERPNKFDQASKYPGLQTFFTVTKYKQHPADARRNNKIEMKQEVSKKKINLAEKILSDKVPDMVTVFRVRSLRIEISYVQTFPSLSLNQEQKPPISKGITAPFH